MAKKKTLPKLTVAADEKNQTWEMNHARLTYAIEHFVERDGIMPPISVLAQEAQLSRQTVYEHLQDFSQSALYRNQIEGYQILGNKVLAKMAQLALQGDVKAAKVFLNATGFGNNAVPADHKPANYIQVNNSLKIDQVTFMNLPPMIQQQIGNLIRLGIQNQSEQE